MLIIYSNENLSPSELITAFSLYHLTNNLASGVIAVLYMILLLVIIIRSNVNTSQRVTLSFLYAPSLIGRDLSLNLVFDLDM